MSYLPELFESKDYATAIKLLDSMAEEAEGVARASVLCNRALCYQKMDLHRKALKNYEEALRCNEHFARAHMGRGRALQALGRPAEAKAAWQAAIDGFSPGDDLQTMEDAIVFKRNPELCNAPVLHAPPPVPAARPPQAQNGVARPAPTPTPSPSPQPQPAPRQPVVQQRSQPRQAADAAAAVAKAVEHINAGNIDAALQLLDDAIAASPTPNMGALIARGTARALKRDLDGAIEDFTGSIKIFPNYGDTWKRRGQARIANGDREGAAKDFQRALELIPDDQGRAEIRTELAMIHQKDRQLRRAERELTLAVRVDDGNAASWNQLGMARTALGNIEDGCKAYRKSLSLDPKNVEAWFNLAQARKEAAQVKEAEAAFKELFKVLKPGDRTGHIYRVYAHMKQGMGDHMQAIRLLDKGLEPSNLPPHNQIELTFLRGACNHALGYYKAAIKDYSRAFAIQAENLSEEMRQFQALAFLQRDLVYYAYNHLDENVHDFSLDQDIHPLFKELWSKKVPPNQGQLMMCQQRHKRVPSEEEPRAPPPLPDKEQTARLLQVADGMGELLQNRHQGFLPNKRQQRMGGLAAIELAQAVKELVEARRKGEKVWVTKGATVSTEPHVFGWRDAMDIVVKWRQLSEPNDQVIWVDLLTKEEFENGFGSHTPMYSGQTKCVRYYMNFKRSLRLLKEIMLKEGKAFDAGSNPIPLGGDTARDAISQAEDAEAMWAAVGKDCWCVVPIKSTLNPEKVLEGTRLTVVKMGEMEGHYEVSIRTPVTPPRWKEFDAELAAVWEGLLDALVYGDKPAVAVAVLTFVYYWYNFMPLARGTAVCGHITLLSLFAVAGMPLTAAIPVNYQVDWEALLQQSPADFIASLSSWLLPAEALASPERPAPSAPTANGGSAAAAPEGTAAATEEPKAPTTPEAAQGAKVLAGVAQELVEGNVMGEGAPQASEHPVAQAGGSGLENLPSVKLLIPTLRNRLEILNGPKVPRI